MEQKQVYTISIKPRAPGYDLSRTPSPVVFSSRSQAYDFKRKADKLIEKSGRNFYTTFQESTMDHTGYWKDLRDDLEDLKQKAKGVLENMIHTVVVDNKVNGDAPPYVFLFSSYTKALEFARTVDRTIEMADASDQYKIFVNSARTDDTDALDWLYDDLGDKIGAKASNTNHKKQNEIIRN